MKRFALEVKSNVVRWIETEDFKSFKIQETSNIRHDLKFENIKFQRSDIIGTNGAISRYNGKAVIILCRTINNGKKGFAICSPQGQVKFVTEKEAVSIANKLGIANGKVVSNSFISAIRGDYDLVEEVNFDNANKEKEIASNNKLLPREQGIKFLIDLKPAGFKSLIENNKINEALDMWLDNAKEEQEEFNKYKDFGIQQVTNFINQIKQDAKTYPNYKEQILGIKDKLNIPLYEITDLMLKENAEEGMK